MTCQRAFIQIDIDRKVALSGMILDRCVASRAYVSMQGLQGLLIEKGTYVWKIHSYLSHLVWLKLGFATLFCPWLTMSDYLWEMRGIVQIFPRRESSHHMGNSTCLENPILSSLHIKRPVTIIRIVIW